MRKRLEIGKYKKDAKKRLKIKMLLMKFKHRMRERKQHLYGRRKKLESFDEKFILNILSNLGIEESIFWNIVSGV